MTDRRLVGYVVGSALMTLMALLLAGCSGSTPTLTPLPESVVVHVAPDGSGDYHTLEEAVQSVPEGGRIVLAAGTYRLENPLRLGKALSLMGAGMDETEIVSQGQGYVIRFVGDGPFAATDITFRHEGGANSDVVVVEGAEVTLVRCRFVGEKGIGLRLLGSTTGVVRECEIQAARSVAGILIEGQGQLTLEANHSLGNGYGVRLSDQAQATLVGNVCRDNKFGGIRYDDEAGGIARKNDCSENGTGIVVSGQADPTLEENVCVDNTESGFTFRDDAGGVARNNECSRNFGGIGVTDRAQPTLEGNTCADNVTAGIAYFGNAGGLARENECVRNGVHGIGLFDEAQPTLEENICSDNGQSGISYAGNAGGLARNNRCSGNVVGIYIAETADPDLKSNNVRGNSQADIQDLRP